MEALDTYHKKFLYTYIHKTFSNFINTIMRHNYHHYIGKIETQAENVYRTHKTVTANINLANN